MSSDDEEDFAFYGTPLDPIEEDAVPSKRPTPIEEQVVRDKHGKRRFHGAFTGGFSAGYCNTVGSEEGWTPSTFKSSRAEKAVQQFRNPEDFMDEEDKSEFGFAPKVLRATSDYNSSSSRKRTHAKYSTGPIPGQPVLREILQPAKDTVGVRLLRNMGWRPGQGVGPRLSHQQKKIQKKEIKKASGKVYGCTLPGSTSTHSGGSGEDSSGNSEDDMKSVTFAPDDYGAFIVKTKDDVFGIGYKGLDKRPVLSGHVELFEPSFLGMQEKKKKVAIWGQAFGVGAMEEDDEDIYARDDMSQYDFALESSAMIAQRKHDERAAEKRGLLALTAPREAGAPLEGFVLGKNQPNSQRKFFKPPELPLGYKAIHETKSSRWDVTTKGENPIKKQGLGRHELDAKGRASILDEPLPKPVVPVASQIQERSSEIPASLPLLSGNLFRPFASQPDKQARYEKFLEFSRSGQKDLLPSIQPLSMTDWDKEHERSEFEQAARLYKPLCGIMSDKFVSASQPDDALNPLKPVERTRHGNEEMQKAAKMKMFGKLTRTKDVWQPCSLLCKRFNVPQPNCGLDASKPTQRSSTFSVFDFLEASSHNTPKECEGVPTQKHIPAMDHVEPEPMSEENSRNVMEQPDKEPPTTKKLPPISDTLARLLADDTGKVQPEPEEKPDLFKAIFLSSSEDSGSDSESEGEMSPSKAVSVADKTTGRNENDNAPRNLSPPRGIFANLDLDAINARPSEKQNQKVNVPQDNIDADQSLPIKTEEPQDDLTYGPRLPAALPKSGTSNPSNNTPNISLHYGSNSAVWVERPPKTDKNGSAFISVDSSDDSDSSTSGSEKKKSSKKKKHRKHSHSKHKKEKKEKKHKKHKSKSKHKKRS